MCLTAGAHSYATDSPFDASLKTRLLSQVCALDQHELLLTVHLVAGHADVQSKAK